MKKLVAVVVVAVLAAVVAQYQIKSIRGAQRSSEAKIAELNLALQERTASLHDIEQRVARMKRLLDAVALAQGRARSDVDNLLSVTPIEAQRDVAAELRKMREVK